MTTSDTQKPPIWGTPRAALIWYDFCPGATLLDASGGVSDVKKYDYIICFDPDCPDAALFSNLAERLNTDGRLLLALYNKYGLKHWCGARGGFLKKPFGELEGGGTMISGAAIRRELHKSGFVSQKWYYPIADHHYPKAVYSENKLPNRFLATISPPQLTDGEGVLLHESAILPGVIENNMFTYMCDAFIVEAALQKNAVMCPVDFAALTLWRPPERAFITAVYSDGTARKTAIHPEGVKSLEKLAENHARLQKCGIDTVPLTLSGNSAEMPAVPHETLWDYIQGRARDGLFDREEFIKIFDRLRDDILKSSEQSPPGSHGWDEAFGPVLEYAYNEMIPANCFFHAENDRFIYFDQEHALQKTPYSIPLSRALMSITYSAELSAHPELMTLFEELKERYSLADIWDELIKIERRFTAGLVDTDEMREYSRAVTAANAAVNANRRAHDARVAAEILIRRYKSVGLYGFGKNGIALAAALEAFGNPPAFIADKKTGGLPENAEADIIVVTPKEGAEEIAAELRRVTDIPVTTVDEVFRSGR